MISIQKVADKKKFQPMAVAPIQSRVSVLDKVESAVTDTRL